MPDNIQYWAVTSKGFRSINSEEDLMPGEWIQYGETPVIPHDYVGEAQIKKDGLIREVEEVTGDLIVWLGLDIISDADKERLKLWMVYSKAVKAVNVNLAPNIEWPQMPE